VIQLSEIDWKDADDLEAFAPHRAAGAATIALLHREMVCGYSVCSGAQATLLDLDAAPTLRDLILRGHWRCGDRYGVPPSKIDGVLGIVKAYTRVGTGHFPNSTTRWAGLRSAGK
jgi:adenylosuccinate synthase